MYFKFICIEISNNNQIGTNIDDNIDKYIVSIKAYSVVT